MTDILATVNTESVCPSFDASVEFLGDKYSRRGIFGGLTAEAAALDRRILATRLENPSSFIYEDAMASDYRNRYRTGSADGKPVMTVDDFFRLIRDEARRSEKAADASARAAAVISRENTDRRIMREARPACPYSVMEARDVGSAYSAGKRRQVIIGGEEREMRVVKPGSNRKIGIFRLADKYLTDDPLVPAKKSYRNASGTIAAISLILVFTLVLILPILMSVMIHNEASAIRTLESELASKKNEAKQLSVELDAKNDVFMLEELAVGKYHMMPLDRSAYNLIRLRPEDTIDLIESPKSEGAVPALLSALGIRIGGGR